VETMSSSPSQLGPKIFNKEQLWQECRLPAGARRLLRHLAGHWEGPDLALLLWVAQELHERNWLTAEDWALIFTHWVKECASLGQALACAWQERTTKWPALFLIWEDRRYVTFPVWPPARPTGALDLETGLWGPGPPAALERIWYDVGLIFLGQMQRKGNSPAKQHS